MEEKQENKVKKEIPYPYGLGRRKTSVARVFLIPDGKKIKLFVNNRDRDFETYFPSESMKARIKTPLYLTGTLEKFGLYITVRGGGVSAQADAIKLGIARALVSYNAEFRRVLKEKGMLTRDPREKERRKYGLHKARKAPQYHKR